MSIIPGPFDEQSVLLCTIVSHFRLLLSGGSHDSHDRLNIDTPSLPETAAQGNDGVDFFFLANDSSTTDRCHD